MQELRRAATERTTGDTAVDGLLAGLAGGAVMMLALMLVTLLQKEAPFLAPGYFDPARSGSWPTGLLAHLAVSAIYGVILALMLAGLGRLQPHFRRRRWLWGAAYGLLLYGLARGVVLTAVDSPLTQISGLALLLGHLAYGLVSGYWLDRQQDKL